jgi:TRAP-type C4-dicarboxylate transport system permease large subunit
LGHTQNVVLVLLLINILLLIVGFFMEPVAAITILTPVLLPLVVELGVDPVHFGIMMVLNLMLGLLTPPVGMVLYVLARVADIKFESAASATAPFLIPLGIVLLLITYVPALSMWLPTLLYR